MASKCQELGSLLRLFPRSSQLFAALAMFASLVSSSCGGDIAKPPTNDIPLASIVIDGGPRALEIGSVITFTATARDTAGKVISVPLAWRSSVDSIATFARDGKLTANDTGRTIVTASALGVTSGGVEVLVVWQGPANVAALRFNPPNAISPGTDLGDSIRVVLTNTAGGLVAGKVVFAVTAGGGTVSPAKPAIVNATQAVAAAKWVLGPTAGVNTVTATVVGDDSLPNTRVKGNPVTFTVRSYAALTVVAGDGQTASVLSALPTAPSVRLVDSAGKPRAGIPITFAATGNGRVAKTVASTSVDGVASPGVWTLGDAAGDQQLIATVESAKIILHATATGSTVQFAAVAVATTQAATCALTNDQFVSCFGQPPQIGSGDTLKTSTPTLTKGGVHLTSVVGASSGAHFCGTDPLLSVYCWGLNALVDTTGVVVNMASPTKLPSNIAWLQVTPGGQHNCALASDKTAYCWGFDTTGQLGDNRTARRFVPEPVVGGFKFAALAAGGSHECGITTDAALFCWGLNSNGQLGDGTSTNRLTPTAVSGSLKFKSIGAGGGWTCGLIDTGVAHCWGAGTGKAVPAPYAGAPVFASLSVGSAHACALTPDGTAYCWGDNSAGQLGDNTTTSRDAPTAVATTLHFASISAGFQHTCGITVEGLVACWGRDSAGEVGLSTPFDQLTPRFVVLGVKP
jgi:hypothetical protein